MAILETLFDILSASAGAVLGAVITYMLNHRRNQNMASQVVVSRQALDKIKLENEDLLRQIREKENLILQLQVQILGTNKKKKAGTKSVARRAKTRRT